MKRKVLGAAIGQFVHIAGLDHFLRRCEQEGWCALSLGPAVPPSALLAAVEVEKPSMVAVSFRLTADDAVPLFRQLQLGTVTLSAPPPQWVFGGTPPVAEKARECGLFARVFDGTEDMDDVVAFITGESGHKAVRTFSQGLVSRIKESFPIPLIRHHYGEPDVARTVAAYAVSRGEADASIGPDQTRRNSFFIRRAWTRNKTAPAVCRFDGQRTSKLFTKRRAEATIRLYGVTVALRT